MTVVDHLWPRDQMFLVSQFCLPRGQLRTGEQIAWVSTDDLRLGLIQFWQGHAQFIRDGMIAGIAVPVSLTVNGSLCIDSFRRSADPFRRPFTSITGAR